MEKIVTLEIPEGIKSIEVYKTPSGIIIDFTRDNNSVKIGDVIVWDKNGRRNPIYVVQQNINPYKHDLWESFSISMHSGNKWQPFVSEFRGMKDYCGIASEKERLAYLWDIEQQTSYVWDESKRRMIKKR